MKIWSSRVYRNNAGTYVWHYEENEKGEIIKNRIWFNHHDVYGDSEHETVFYKKVGKKWVLLKEEKC